MTDTSERGSHPAETMLHEWAEGVLAAERAEPVRRHVERCPACAREVDRFRELRASLAALPRELDPGVDLRPGIRARARAGRTVPRGRLVAAAAVLIVATAAVLARGLNDRARPVPADPDPGAALAADRPMAPPVEATMRSLDEEYARAAEELRGAVQAAGELPPMAADLFRADLAAVDRALAESREALVRHPGSEAAWQLVLAAHRQRIDVLRRAATLMTEDQEAG